jgi:ClpA/ClpB-like protein
VTHLAKQKRFPGDPCQRSLGYDEQMGARPLARVIQEHIKKPLADEVLFGQLEGGGHVRVVLVKDEATDKDSDTVRAKQRMERDGALAPFSQNAV